MTTFAQRHIGSNDQEIQDMLGCLDVKDLETLSQSAIPADIRLKTSLELPDASSEENVLNELKRMAARNQVHRSFIGMGYYDCITPPIILRNILENPAWYTQYTPYQAEIAQGRLEALFNFQTMVADLTGLPLANASLLDEATAAAEAMTMCRAVSQQPGMTFFVAEDCHPQIIAVLQTRAHPLGIAVQVGNPDSLNFNNQDIFGILLAYPSTDGHIRSVADIARQANNAGTLVVASTDLLALTLLVPPGEWGADIAIGSSQRFGVPMGFGGPHAAFLATQHTFKRHIPGRIVGLSKDAQGKPAYRLALQTREQHIRRDRATSNICTAQVLLANIASMYAVYHGPDGLHKIANRIHHLTNLMAEGLQHLGCQLSSHRFFDTLRVYPSGVTVLQIKERARQAFLNLRQYPDGSFGIALDETTTIHDVNQLLALFSASGSLSLNLEDLSVPPSSISTQEFLRTSSYLTQPVFHDHRSEHELLRYIHRLAAKDLSLVHSMIPLGSCTMKLNATTEMIPISWPEFSRLHPFAPDDQSHGYRILFQQLEDWLAEVTGFSAVSLQPNAGSQGEYAGLMVIRAYHAHHGQSNRNICLIPVSAHGTNPASAVMAGMKVVTVACDLHGNIDLQDLKAKAQQHRNALSAFMVTYPSTHGVFEETIRQVCRIVHDHGGQVYMDGANMNAMVGLCRPGDMGADVCHLNLHKTFCIPHGGGGPGMGPIAVAQHLAPFLPGHPCSPHNHDLAIGPIAAAPYGSPNILPISWTYMKLMGKDGLTKASQVAILNANYMAHRLKKHYSVVFTGTNGMAAHEFILDFRPFKKSADVEVEDVAKRLMDFGFHAPTVSWPVAGTMMIEPTESESKAEMDRYCEALILIRQEITDVEEGRLPRDNNPLKHAPHTIETIAKTEWPHPYSREQAAFPASWLREHKFWPAVSRIDSAYGDRNLVCTCPPLDLFPSQ
ncbi:MAG: aminomethyl-transferring glycine dehydrogenase [Nitrospiraceae bacterium]|nr:aminomethyl-transferring glycine dehydrogenase [Nitrospiraceae bacterium]